MEMQVRIVDGPALDRLRKLARVMSPDQRLLQNRKAGIKMHALVIDTFRNEGATEGRPKWEDLKAGGRWVRRVGKDGVRRRARFQDIRRDRSGLPILKEGGGFITAYKILQDTGALRQSYKPLADENFAGVGTLTGMEHADIALRHEFGDPSTNLPARPMLPTPTFAVAVTYSVYKFALEAAASR